MDFLTLVGIAFVIFMGWSGYQSGKKHNTTKKKPSEKKKEGGAKCIMCDKPAVSDFTFSGKPFCAEHGRAYFRLMLQDQNSHKVFYH